MQLTSESVGVPQDKYSTQLFAPFISIDATVEPNPPPRDYEESITIEQGVSVDALRSYALSGEMNTPSTAFALMGLDRVARMGLLD